MIALLLAFLIVAGVILIPPVLLYGCWELIRVGLPNLPDAPLISFIGFWFLVVLLKALVKP